MAERCQAKPSPRSQARAPGQYAQASGSPAAGAVSSIGTVNKIAGSVTVLRNGVAVTLNVGDQILKSDVVQTGAGSSIAIILIDGTLLNLGAATRMAMKSSPTMRTPTQM